MLRFFSLCGMWLNDWSVGVRISRIQLMSSARRQGPVASVSLTFSPCLPNAKLNKQKMFFLYILLFAIALMKFYHAPHFKQAMNECVSWSVLVGVRSTSVDWVDICEQLVIMSHLSGAHACKKHSRLKSFSGRSVCRYVVRLVPAPSSGLRPETMPRSAVGVDVAARPVGFCRAKVGWHELNFLLLNLCPHAHGKYTCQVSRQLRSG